MASFGINCVEVLDSVTRESVKYLYEKHRKCTAKMFSILIHRIFIIRRYFIVFTFVDDMDILNSISSLILCRVVILL
jgi:hypothetical protein